MESGTKCYDSSSDSSSLDPKKSDVNKKTDEFPETVHRDTSFIYLFSPNNSIYRMSQVLIPLRSASMNQNLQILMNNLKMPQ